MCYEALLWVAPELLALSATRYRAELQPELGLVTRWDAEIGDAVARSLRLVALRLDEPLDLGAVHRGEV